MASTAELLALVPMFAELDFAELEDLADTTQLRTFVAGEHFFQIGEPGRSLYVLTRGSVQVQHPDQEAHFQLAELGPGDFFGEMALLNNAPRTATVTAVGPVDALVLDKVDFRRIVTERPEVALKILEAMSVRVRGADELIQELTGRTIRDPLTGLLNKQAFSDQLTQEVERTRRYGGSFSLIVVDFDDFGRVNETVGREHGDEILIWFGRLLSEHTRGSDVPFRFEADAFTVLCPWTGREFARVVADRITALIEEARPPIEGKIDLSVSTGVATCPKDGAEPLALYHAAERAMRDSVS